MLCATEISRRKTEILEIQALLHSDREWECGRSVNDLAEMDAVEQRTISLKMTICPAEELAVTYAGYL